MARIRLWAEDVPDLKVGDHFEVVAIGRVSEINEKLMDDAGSVSKMVDLGVYRIRIGDGPEIKTWGM